MLKCDNNGEFWTKIVFSGLVTFFINGNVNRYNNYSYWFCEISHWIVDSHEHQLIKLNTWIGILGDKFVELFLTNRNLNAKLYYNVFKNQIIPTIFIRIQLLGFTANRVVLRPIMGDT